MIACRGDAHACVAGTIAHSCGAQGFGGRGIVPYFERARSEFDSSANRASQNRFVSLFLSLCVWESLSRVSQLVLLFSHHTFVILVSSQSIYHPWHNAENVNLEFTEDALREVTCVPNFNLRTHSWHLLYDRKRIFPPLILPFSAMHFFFTDSAPGCGGQFQRGKHWGSSPVHGD